jgi:hypothetical protein
MLTVQGGVVSSSGNQNVLKMSLPQLCVEVTGQLQTLPIFTYCDELPMPVGEEDGCATEPVRIILTVNPLTPNDLIKTSRSEPFKN